MKEKYITDKYPYGMIFGKYPDGSVCFCTTNRDLAKVSEDDAKTLIEDRERLVDLIVSMAQEWDKSDSKAFEEFWYNQYNHK